MQIKKKNSITFFKDQGYLPQFDLEDSFYFLCKVYQYFNNILWLNLSTRNWTLHHDYILSLQEKHLDQKITYDSPQKNKNITQTIYYFHDIHSWNHTAAQSYSFNHSPVQTDWLSILVLRKTIHLWRHYTHSHKSTRKNDALSWFWQLLLCGRMYVNCSWFSVVPDSVNEKQFV